ncbi:MAG: T9SS type A sorting domain-containing protein, partial [Bacteroidales bacterium]
KLTTDTYRKNDTCKKMIKKVAIENSAKTKVTIYPNPANEQIHIESSIPIEKLTICNLSGQMLVDRVPDNANTCTIFISAFAKGTYIVNLYTHLGVEKRKITVFK